MKAYELTAEQVNGHCELYDLATKAGHASLKSMLDDHKRWGDDVNEIAADLKEEIAAQGMAPGEYETPLMTAKETNTMKNENTLAVGDTVKTPDGIGTLEDAKLGHVVFPDGEHGYYGSEQITKTGEREDYAE